MPKKSLRDKIESIIFAGLKPGGATTSPGAQRSSGWFRWLGPYREIIERFLNRSAPSDPLYLSRRTWQQRLKTGLLLAIPCVVLAGVIGFLVFGNMQRHDAPPKQPSTAEIAARLLPDLSKSLPPGTNPELEVMEVRLDPDGSTIEGRVRNRSDHRIAHADLIFDLADQLGSRLGAVDAQVNNVEPGAVVPFHLAIVQHSAAVAIVREVRTQ